VSYLCLNLEESPRYENAPATAPYRLSTINHFFPLQAARIAPGRTDIDRADELRNIEGSVARLVDAFDPVGSLNYRAYMNTLVVLFALAGFDWTYTAGAGTLATVGPNVTAVTGTNTLNSTVITVVNNGGFPTLGTLNINGVLVTYTGKSADGLSFTGCGAHAAYVGAESVKDVLPTGTNKWVLNKRVGPVPRTAQLRLVYAEHSIWLQGQGYGVSNLTMNAAGDITTELMGLVYARLTSDPGLSPSIDSATIRPALRGDLYLTWLANSATTDDFSIAIANPLVRRRTLSLTTPSKFADVMEMGDERVALTGSIPKSKLAAADIDALQSGATFAAGATWTLPVNIGATNYPYMVDVDMPSCQLTGGEPDELANKRRFGHGLDFFAAWDETAGYDARITVVNGVSTIAAPFGT
jgi:hypothetical protein